MSSSTGFASCNDGTKDGDETDVDCGGACGPCALGAGCAKDQDCVAATTSTGAGGGGASAIHCVDDICSPPLQTHWIERNTGSPPPPAPSARRYVRFAYDETTHRSLLYGGLGVDTMNPSDALWAWDGNQWSTVPLPGSGTPSVSYNGAWVFDPIRLRTILIPGVDNVSMMLGISTVYDWDGAVLAASSVAADPGFTPRHGVGIAYDTDKQEMIVVGGFVASGMSGALVDETWVLPSASLVWKAAAPAPTSLYGWGAAYDTVHKQLVLVGGIDTNNVDHPGTYLFDGTTWTTPTNTGNAACTMRSNMGIAWDSRRKRVVIYGGFDDNETTCEWDGKQWSDVSPTASPTGGERNGTSMTFDTARGRICMSGPQPDIWEYYASANGCTTDGDCDTGHCVDGLCCETSKCGTCQACNVDAGSAGTCTNVPAGKRDPDSCGGTCDGNGSCKP